MTDEGLLARARQLEARGEMENAAAAYEMLGQWADAARLYTMALVPAKAARAMLSGVASVSPELDAATIERAKIAAAFYREAGNTGAAGKILAALAGTGPAVTLAELEAPVPSTPPRSAAPPHGDDRRSHAPTIDPPARASIAAPASSISASTPRPSTLASSTPVAPTISSRAPGAHAASQPPVLASSPPLTTPSEPAVMRRSFGAEESEHARRAPVEVPAAPSVPRVTAAPPADGTPTEGTPRSGPSAMRSASGLMRPGRFTAPGTSSDADGPTPSPRTAVRSNEAPLPAEQRAGARAAGWRDTSDAKTEETIRQFLDAGKKGSAARVALEAGQHARALVWFEELGLPYQAGVCLRALSRPAEALAMLLTVPLSDQRYRRACLDVIELAAEVGRLDFEVDRFVTPCVAEGVKEPEESEAFMRLAELYRANGFGPGARRCAEAVLRAHPDDERAKALLSSVSERPRERGTPLPMDYSRGELPPLLSLDEFAKLARKHAPPPPVRRASIIPAGRASDEG